jgi:ParB-like chromosome segregation protein Spo0J
MKKKEIIDLQYQIADATRKICALITMMDSVEQKGDMLNFVRKELHSVSPWKHNPVDFVEWVKSDHVSANDYNPNSVAPPEMKLLKVSIEEDGYTQPVVSDKKKENLRIVVDGFHRSRCGKEYTSIKEKNHGYIPVTTIRDNKTNISDKMASTIRHNRARGTHAIKGMSDIVLALVRGGWSDVDICKHLGMDAEEVIRLKQITGLKEAFGNHEFSKSWDEFESKLKKDEK